MASDHHPIAQWINTISRTIARIRKRNSAHLQRFAPV
jgi:hypothetical protein